MKRIGLSDSRGLGSFFLWEHKSTKIPWLHLFYCCRRREQNCSDYFTSHNHVITPDWSTTRPRDITEPRDWLAVLLKNPWNPSEWPDHLVMMDRPPPQYKTSTVILLLGHVHSGRKLYPWKVHWGMQGDLGMPTPSLGPISFILMQICYQIISFAQTTWNR